MSSSILWYLCLPTPSKPHGLEWCCGSCGARNTSEEPALCKFCTSGTRSKSWVLKDLLDQMSRALCDQLEEDTPTTVTTILPPDLLLYILLSPHNRCMTGLIHRAYRLEEAVDCKCVEGSDDPKSATVEKNQPLTPLSLDPDRLLDTLDDSFDGDLDENFLLDSPESARSCMEDSLPLEFAAMTVSLPLDITNGTLEEVLHTGPGGVGRNNPTQPSNSSDLYKPLCEVSPHRDGDTDPDIGEQPATNRVMHNVSSSQDEMEGITMPWSPLELLSIENHDT